MKYLASSSSVKSPTSSLLRSRSIKSTLFTPSLDPGDSAIHHTMNIHGSNPNNSGKQRRGLLLCYKGKNTKRNKDLLDSYQNNLEKLIKIRNSKWII